MEALGNEKNVRRVIAKAWSDPIFKERLKRNPNVVLAEMGAGTPGGVPIEVVENTFERVHLVLPLPPTTGEHPHGEIDLPDGIEIVKVENTTEKAYFVIPEYPIPDEFDDWTSSFLSSEGLFPCCLYGPPTLGGKYTWKHTS